MTQQTGLRRRAKSRYLDGTKLRAERTAAGLNQMELARLVDVDPSQLSHWERGDWGCQIGTLHQLAGALKITPDRLMRDQAKAA